MLLRLFVATVIVAGVAMTVLGFVRGDWPDYTVIGLLTALAVAAEFFQVKMYGENTISVSVGVAFAAALIAGIPGSPSSAPASPSPTTCRGGLRFTRLRSTGPCTCSRGWRPH